MAGLAKGHHDRLAHFIAAMVPGVGLDQALTLNGLGLHEELALARRGGKFRRALRCLQVLSAGFMHSRGWKGGGRGGGVPSGADITFLKESRLMRRG